MINLSIYRALSKVLAPIANAYIWFRSFKEPSYRKGLRERRGFVDFPVEAGAIWVHAASMGEAKSAVRLVQSIIERGDQVFLTTTTPAGRRVFAEKFERLPGQSFIPIDSPSAVKRFVNRVKPKMAVLVELELWPNLLAELEQQAIPVVLISARLSHQSLVRYQRIGSLVTRSVRGLSLVAAQTELDAKRFVELGVSPSRVQVLGSLKFDQEFDSEQLERGRRLRLSIGMERPVWVALSVREGEEEIVVEAHEKLRESYPSVLLIIIPRHETQFEPLANWLSSRKDRHVVWSDEHQVSSSASILLADVMGELPVFLSASDVAFVGGSLVPVGGHNLLEPAALGVPVLVGPSVRNFQQVDDLLAEAGGRLRVSNADDLTEALLSLLGDASERREMGQRAAAVFSAHQGVCERTVAAIYATINGPKPD